MIRRMASGFAGRHWIVALAAAKGFTEGLVNVGLPVKLDALGWQEAALGMRAGTSAGSYALTCLLASFLVVRRAPARPLMVGACLVTGAAVFGLRLSDSVAWVYAFSVLNAVGTAFFWVPLMAWIGEGSDEHLVGDIAAFNCAWMGALAVGNVAAGQLEVLRSGLALAVGGCALLAVACLVPFAHIRGQQATRATGPADGFRLPRRYLLAAWLVAVLTAVGVTVPEAIFVKLHSALGHGPGTYGVLWFVMGMSRVGAVLCMAGWQGWRYRRWPMAAALVLAAGGSVVLVVASSPWAFALGFVLLGLGAGAGYLLGFYYSVHGRSDRRRNAGLFEGMIVSQSILAGPVGGALATHFARRTPYGVHAALAVLMAVAVVALLRRARVPAGER